MRGVGGANRNRTDDLLNAIHVAGAARRIRKRWDSGGIAARFSSVDEAISFARLALDEATKAAIVEGDKRNFGRYLDEWDVAHERAHAARKRPASVVRRDGIQRCLVGLDQAEPDGGHA